MAHSLFNLFKVHCNETALRIADQLYNQSQELYRRINNEKQKVII